MFKSAKMSSSSSSFLRRSVSDSSFFHVDVVEDCAFFCFLLPFLLGETDLVLFLSSSLLSRVLINFLELRNNAAITTKVVLHSLTNKSGITTGISTFRDSCLVMAWSLTTKGAS